MTQDELKAEIHAQLTTRLSRLGMKASEVDDELDLVRTGLLDSLGFIDLVAALEDVTGKQVDLEAALVQENATTVSSLLRLFR